MPSEENIYEWWNRKIEKLLEKLALMSLASVISRLTTWQYAIIVEVLISLAGLQLKNMSYTVCGLKMTGPEVQRKPLKI